MATPPRAVTERGAPIPQALDLERAVLGVAMIDPSTVPVILERLTAEAFYSDHNRVIFARLMALHAQGRAVDSVLVADALREADELDAVGGRAALALLVDEATTATLVGDYIDRIAEAARKRELLALAHDVEHAALNGQGSPAILARVRDRLDRAERLGQSPTPPDAGHAEVIDLADLLTREIAKPRSLVGSALLIEQGISIVVGSPRVGKSLLCSNLALTRTFGLPWLGFTVDPGVTLYLQAEVPEAWLQQRFALMVDELRTPDGPCPVPPNRLLTVTRRGLFLDTAEGRDALTAILDQCPARPDLIILDPLARFYSGDENSQHDVGRFVATLDAFIARHKIAWLIPHHPSKPIKGDAREGGARMRGMSGLWAAADATWTLTRRDDAATGLLLTVDDLRHAEPPQPLYLDRTRGLWLTRAAAPTNPRLDAVVDCLKFMGLTWTHLAQAVMADLKVSESTATRLIREASKAGRIVQDPDGVYRQPSPNRHPASDGEGTL